LYSRTSPPAGKRKVGVQTSWVEASDARTRRAETRPVRIVVNFIADEKGKERKG
jgi:hypothetical protein